MSWSVSLIGTPEGVSKALDEYGSTLSGQSKDEFEKAEPALNQLLSLVVGENNYVSLRASGHATITDGVTTYSTVSVALDQFYGKWNS